MKRKNVFVTAVVLIILTSSIAVQKDTSQINLDKPIIRTDRFGQNEKIQQ